MPTKEAIRPGDGQHQWQGHQDNPGFRVAHLRRRLQGCKLLGGQSGPNGDGGYDRTHVGLENIGPHAGHVPHVVTDVIGNHTGIARVILGNIGLHLTHQVSADVGGLGIDSASHSGKPARWELAPMANPLMTLAVSGFP